MLKCHEFSLYLFLYFSAVYSVISVCVFCMTVVSVFVINQSMIVLFFDPPTYLCPYFRGGLGNLMFMYASLYGIAKNKKMILVLEKKDHINTVFPNLDVLKLNNTSSVCGVNVQVVGEKRPCAYDIETISFNRRRNSQHRSYLQSWKYFEKFESAIRKQFGFTKEVQTQAQSIINKYTSSYIKQKGISENLQTIGIHLRRGDYLKDYNIKYGYQTVNKEYMEKALKYYRTKFKNCLFLVFTGHSKDAVKWRAENINGSDVIHVEANSRNVDMCALSKCNHTIITVGSFGWWAAWLNNGNTVYFKDVARQNSSLRSDFSDDMKDFFPPNWIGLS